MYVVYEIVNIIKTPSDSEAGDVKSPKIILVTGVFRVFVGMSH